MAKCYTRITEDNGVTMYCILDTARHELSEFIDEDGIAIGFSLGEFWKQDCPWVISSPLIASEDEERFVAMMNRFDEHMASWYRSEWEDGKVWFEGLGLLKAVEAEEHPEE